MSSYFYRYLAMLVFVALLSGVELKARLDGDQSVSIFDIAVCFVWLAGVIYLVIDEHKLKDAYRTAEKEPT